MARPKKSADAARSHVVAFRLNDAEMARLRSEADAAGEAAGETARAKVTGAGPSVRFASKRRSGPTESPAMFELRRQLMRVGVNLNQIARHLHMSGEHEPEELRNACRDLDDLFRALLGGSFLK
jgi:hypothetical protein